MSQATKSMGRMQKEAQRTNTYLGKFDKTMGNMQRKLIGLASAAVFGGFIASIKRTIDTMDDLAKSAQRLGTTTEALSKLRYAADLSGVSAGNLSTAIRQLSTAVSDLSAGRATDATRALQELGTSVKDAAGNFKSSDQLLADLADRFAAMPDGVQKTALAVKLFGRAGADLIPLLNGGGDAIRKMGDEAERLGIVVDTRVAKAAEQLNDSFTRMQAATDGMRIAFASGLVPALNEFISGLGETSTNTQLFVEAGYKVGQTANVLGASFSILTNILHNGLAAVTGLAKGVGILVGAFTTGNFTQLVDDAKSVFAEFTSTVMQNHEDIQRNWSSLLSAYNDTYEQFRAKMESSPPIKLPTPEFNMPDISGASTGGAGEDRFAKFRESALLAQQAIEDLVPKVEILDELLFSGEIDMGVYDDLVDKLFNVREAAGAAGEAMKSSLGSEIESVFSGLSYALEDGSRGFKDWAKSSIKQIAAVILKMQALKLIASFFPGLGLAAAKGAAFDAGGLVPFATGGVVSSPTLFPFSGGTGLMGEAGPEAIMPLSRGPSGDLGVKANINVNVQNHAGAPVDVQRRGNDIDIIIGQIAGGIVKGGSAISRAMEQAYGVNRVQGVVS